MNPEYFMRLAIAEAKKGDAPYGAVIVKDDQVVAFAHNTVGRDNDPSAHAEINVVRRLTAQLQSFSLEGYSIYTTGEPCPMCAAACVWSGIAEIIYGASIQDLILANQAQIQISCEEVIAKSFRNIKVTKGILRQECLNLFA
ncbi:Cytidine/deoxycytidylate deaminase, zinc-binding region [Trichormus variabilis ATCC 29413]|uniref:Cytidine/deoxycytidylate deaminase, zinc-binding region n=2 Tax=Anabaena variabilis TaxID=264691 RepID=Q3MBI5_TRIV2|nr:MULTISPECIES: nucleoside deaminase [Nostocaceae]ABA21651.1 Cytidine/deoxycytidylate deaminase, zinc-binding region [Trichormus variabilis ATCC 29413]MBC1215376.1 nucleoside deaminase [Trichormus variabilis ARAD]MBC1255060.1 nucleoside deaminase [Trichormus variabilis V5]MBC1268609.1 nucleoside deaminase [Trichormus variabilis FSR]MBC1302274.1 nucleoside deaminase [Trichormus variabilis N2B]